MKDEDHLAAIVWNALSLMNSETYYADDPQVCDITNWFKDGKPNVDKPKDNENIIAMANPVEYGTIKFGGDEYAPMLFQDGCYHYVKK